MGIMQKGYRYLSVFAVLQEGVETFSLPLHARWYYQ